MVGAPADHIAPAPTPSRAPHTSSWSPAGTSGRPRPGRVARRDSAGPDIRPNTHGWTAIGMPWLAVGLIAPATRNACKFSRGRLSTCIQVDVQPVFVLGLNRLGGDYGSLRVPVTGCRRQTYCNQAVRVCDRTGSSRPRHGVFGFIPLRGNLVGRTGDRANAERLKSEFVRRLAWRGWNVRRRTPAHQSRPLPNLDGPHGTQPRTGRRQSCLVCRSVAGPGPDRLVQVVDQQNNVVMYNLLPPDMSS